MKTFLLFLALTIYSGWVLAGKTIITNSGFTFTPDSVSISMNDTVVFQIASIHNVVEVSQATWMENGNNPLPGGFTLPFGGGQLTGLSAGVHYYVCSPHASLGMKGRIFVNSGLGINTIESNSGKVIITPNPTSGKFTLSYQGPVTEGIPAEELKLDIYNFLGERICSQNDRQPLYSCELDITSFPDGIYFLRIVSGLKTTTVRIIKR